MAQRLGLLEQWLFGDRADRNAINRNADDLSLVEADLSELRSVVQRQGEELLRLRAMLTGLVELLHQKAPFGDEELEHAVRAAWIDLTTPALQARPMTDPYRGMSPGEPSPADIEAAKALLVAAQDHHFNKRFREARAIYHQIVDQHGDTKQATIARQQLENLRNA
jgi:hypothetical protein